MSMDSERVLVLGEGIAGQAAAVALCERGVPVRALALEPAPASESVANREGLDAALDDGDTPEQHAADLLALAGGAGNEAAILALCQAAPGIAQRLSALGVPFERNRDGAFRLLETRGSSRARTLSVSTLTACHVSRRLSARMRAFEASGELVRAVGVELMRLVLDDSGTVIGVVTRDVVTGELSVHPANGVCLATGGFLGLHAADQLAVRPLGGALARVHRAGAALENLSSTSRGLGYRAAGTVRVLPEALVALGALSDDETVLDLTSAQRSDARARAGPALQALLESTGKDALHEPIRVVQVVTRTLGGLRVGFDPVSDSPENMATTLPGLYALGGAAALVRGRAESPGTRLLEALDGAARVARALASYRETSELDRAAGAEAALEDALDGERARIGELFEQAASRSDGDTPHQLARALATAVSGGSAEGLERVAERLASAHLADGSPLANASFRLLLEVTDVLPLGRAIVAEGSP
jgi:succinate dehydrogenase/fumarate reductase flavoprotein subunit